MASRRKRKRINEQVEPAEQAEPPPNRPRKNNPPAPQPQPSVADRVHRRGVAIPPPPSEAAVPAMNKKRTSRNKTAAAAAPSRAPHDPIIRELEPRYTVAAPLVISSSKIRARVAAALAHLGRPGPGRAPAIVLLHARPRDVCKMITIAEQVKRLVAAAGASWWQYNDMFEPVPKLAPPPDLVEETLLPKSSQEAGHNKDDDKDEKDDKDDDDDSYFETMDSFFENAVLPKEEERRELSLRTFLALAPVPELGAKQGVTMQTNARGGGGRAATA